MMNRKCCSEVFTVLNQEMISISFKKVLSYFMLRFFVHYKHWIVNGAVLVADLCLPPCHWLYITVIVSLLYQLLTGIYFSFLLICVPFFSKPFYPPELSFMVLFSPPTIIAPFLLKIFMFSTHNPLLDNSQSAHLFLSSASRSPVFPISSTHNQFSLSSPLNNPLSLHPPTTPSTHHSIPYHLTTTACLMACCLVLVAGAWYWC